jgi:hypothetical protein
LGETRRGGDCFALADESSEETPEELRQRAEDLRECAREARRLAEPLAGFLDAEAERAQRSDPTIWQGPYADRSTTTLVERQTSLHDLAWYLTHDAGRWDTEADALEDRAGHAAGGS